MAKTAPLPGGRYDTAAAAEYLGKSASWLNTQRSFGRGPKFRRIGRTVWYRLEDLDAYLKACEVETADSRKGAA